MHNKSEEAQQLQKTCLVCHRNIFVGAAITYVLVSDCATMPFFDTLVVTERLEKGLNDA